MTPCLYGGPKFLIIKMIPVAKLEAQILYDLVSNISNLIKHLNGDPITITSDNYRTNQAFSKNDTIPHKPWLANDVLSFF